MKRFYFSTSQVVAVAILGLIFLFLNSVPLWHTDIWGHLRFGRSIAQTGQLPQGNPFAPLMRAEVPSNHYCWLSQVALFRIYDLGAQLAGGDSIQQMAGGVDALRFAHALLVLLRLAVLLLVFYRITESLPLSLTGLVLMVVMSRNLALFRPQVLGELCFALLLLGLCRPKLARPARIWIPLLMVLWANLHGSFAIGLTLITLFLLGRMVETGRELNAWRPKTLLTHAQIQPLLIVWGASVLGIALLNPAGPWIYLRTLAMANHPVVLIMDEWQPLTFSLRFGGHWFYLATLVGVVGSMIYARQWLSPTAVLLVFFFAWQPLLHQRALVWWLLISPWIMLPSWASRPANYLTGWRPTHNTASLRKMLVAMAFAVLFARWSIPVQWFVAGHPSPPQRSVSEGTPWQLALELQKDPARKEAWSPELEGWLTQNYPGGRFRGPIFTSETLGDYLIWALPEEMPSFIYSHVHLFTEEHWQLFAAVRYGTEHWNRVLDSAHINLIVVEAELNRNLRSRLHDSPDWEVILDETGDTSKVDRYCRLLIAVRKQPMPVPQMPARTSS